MSQAKKKIRENFRELVFARDGHKCRIPTCGAPAVDAHHIIPREQMPDGGYILSNGISLCALCHMAAETGVFTIPYLAGLI